MQPDVCLRGQPQAHGHEGAGGPDGNLEPAIGADQVPDARGPAGEQVAPEGQAGHEGGQHRGDGVDCVAEHQAEHPEPDDLVDETGGPGQEEAGEYHSEACPGSGVPGRRGPGPVERLGCRCRCCARHDASVMSMECPPAPDLARGSGSFPSDPNSVAAGRWSDGAGKRASRAPCELTPGRGMQVGLARQWTGDAVQRACATGRKDREIARHREGGVYAAAHDVRDADVPDSPGSRWRAGCAGTPPRASTRPAKRQHGVIFRRRRPPLRCCPTARVRWHDGVITPQYTQRLLRPPAQSFFLFGPRSPNVKKR